MSVQLALLKVPALLLLNVTTPLGVLLVPTSVSRTVAVQVVVSCTGMVAGEHVTEVLVERVRATTVKVPLLPRWLPSPP